MLKEIKAKEYFELYKKHKPNLCVHRSYTDISGVGYSWSTGIPQWMTEWGFKDSDDPFIRAESEIIDGETIHKYFSYCL